MNFEKIVNDIDSNMPMPKNAYVGHDGLLYCSVCGKALQTRAVCEPIGLDRIVRCRCACKSENDSFQERMELEEKNRKRRACFADAELINWTFEKDDMKNAKLTRAMKRYADNFKDFKKESKGLLLYGNVGTGKTYFAAAIANALIDNSYKVRMTSFSIIAKELWNASDKQGYIKQLNACDLLILDDLGAERNSEFMQENVYDVIDARYKSGLPFIVTTNLTAEELKSPQEIKYTRIYDRILERCFPVEMKGVSRRRQNLKNSYADTKEKLGL